MNDTFINIILGIFLGLAVFAFFYTLNLVVPLVQESIKKKGFHVKKLFKLNCLRNRH